MEYTVPHYYKKFRCTASECEDTCCAGWAIMIDEKSLRKYKSIKGAFGNRLHNSIDWKEASFKQYQQRCAFLNEENLCDMYLEGGEKMLCKTCRNYPRHIEEFEGIREISLSLSCIEAAKIILGCGEPVHFLTREMEKTEEYEDFDFFLFTKLMDARGLMIEMLQRRTLDIRVRMAMVLALAHDMQTRIKKQKLFAVDELLERYSKEKAELHFEKRTKAFLEEKAEEKYGRMRRMFRIFDRLEVLKKDWPLYLEQKQHTLFAYGRKKYAEQEILFQKTAGYESERREAWSRYAEQLLVYFIFTYFGGAVYDEMAEVKVKMAVVSTLLIQELAKAVWMEQEGVLELGDIVDIAHRYSREVEHSDLNLKRMEHLLEQNVLF